MIELVSAPDCIGCDKCVDVCPTDVFDRTPSGVPVIARQSDCQTCFMCEAYCPTDALYVHPQSTPLETGDVLGEVNKRPDPREKGWGHGGGPAGRAAGGAGGGPPGPTGR
ncbi:4Fe-4S dicluster domain-containing protein, partial [Rhodococcus qingshengii]|uniref:4Fe-4S dicluster domain-containing protein n=1 Tax=Rhodococcus qingshengii TaxID=334542 RepID=UPI003AFA03C5